MCGHGRHLYGSFSVRKDAKCGDVILAHLGSQVGNMVWILLITNRVRRNEVA